MGNLCSSNGGDHDGNNSNSERYNVIGKKSVGFLFCFVFYFGVKTVMFRTWENGKQNSWPNLNTRASPYAPFPNWMFIGIQMSNNKRARDVRPGS